MHPSPCVIQNQLLMKKNTLQFTQSSLMVLFGVVMITAAFLVPPTGVIDTSVLTAFGEILTFAGALIGIDAKYNSKLTTHNHEGD